jgi:hypothetical protein
MPWPFSRRVVPSLVPFGHVDVERAAVGQADALLAAARRHQERHDAASR